MFKKITATTAAILTLFVLSISYTAEEAPVVISVPEGSPPSDAIVLFGGTSLDQWEQPDGSSPAWIVSNGTMTVNKGSIKTKREFGDLQIHVEFCSPAPAKGEGQDRGNSGVYIQGNYEVQVLDSYENETYFDGQCGAIYQIAPPLVNACRPPGIWHSYEIIFRSPHLDSAGKVVKKANITVLHNGVLVQDHVEVEPTGGRMGSTENPKGPIVLQDHNHPVKYRNVWVREL